jgi:hypothetical protein
MPKINILKSQLILIYYIAHYRQFVLIHKSRQTEIPALLDSWVKDKLYVKIMYAQKLLLHIFS